MRRLISAKIRRMGGNPTIAHVWCTAAIHIRRLDIRGGQPKVGQLHDDLALPLTINASLPTIRDNEIFRLDVAMKNRGVVADRHGFTHLREHRRDQTQTGRRQELGGMHGR